MSSVTPIGNLFDYKLAPEEAKIISQVSSLSGKWGYRAGPKSTHTLYEHKLHTPRYRDVYPITNLTDPLFRTLQQGTAYQSDLSNKFYFPLTLQDEPKSAVLVRDLFQSFLQSNNQIERQIKMLANAPFKTWWFYVIKVSAQLFLLLSQGEIDQAQSLSRSVRERLDEQIKK